MKILGFIFPLLLTQNQVSGENDIRGMNHEDVAVDSVDHTDTQYWDRFLQVQSSMQTPGPSVAASDPPSEVPSLAPTKVPSLAPTKVPSLAPTPTPSITPTQAPTLNPTQSPVVKTFVPIPATIAPSPDVSDVPTVNSATSAPTTAAPVTAAPVTPAPVTPAPVTPAPVTAAPVPAPTASPVSTPAPVPQVSVVRQRLTPFALQGGTEWADPESYQSKALARTEAQVGAEEFTDAKLVQYYALYCIYSATNGVPNLITDSIAEFQGNPFPGWISATGWQRNNLDPCDGWLGITCDIQGRVTDFAMVENLMTGFIPEEVTLLASDGPTATGAGNLTYFEVYKNPFLFNNFDNSWMSNLGSNLQFLYVGETGFSGSIPLLPSGLLEVDFAFSLIDGGLTDANFAQSTALEYINLGGNAFNATVPLVFSTFQNLQFLYLSDCFISGDLSYMQGMPSIFEHWIDINPGFGGPIPSFIGDLSTLNSFSVTQSALTGPIPTALGQLTSMQQMWFYGNRLTGQIPTELGLLKLMNRLQLEENSFTGAMPTEVCNNIGFFGRLTKLGADCSDIDFECSCCTCCSLGECNPDLFP